MDLINLSQLKKLTFGNEFNQQVEGKLSKLTQLEELAFGDKFNRSIMQTLVQLNKLKYLELGCNFNQPIELPPNIKILKLNCNNIHLVENLSNSIEELNFGYDFNLELNNLPSSIKIIRFDKSSHYNEKLNCLPKSLEILELSTNYSLELSNISPNCKIIKNSLLNSFLSSIK
jgi:hypothetical protein